MAALDIVTLDTATPQLEVPQAADTYNAPRAFAIAPVSLTGSAATTSFDVTQTWDTSGTPTAIKLNVTDTASASGSLLMDLQVGGASRFSVSKSAGVYFDANVTEQRNGTNAQAFRLYETFTDASNYSRLDVLFYSGNLVFGLNAARAGTGVQRGLGFLTAGNLRWTVGATTGHFLAAADNTYDIGASGATRPRDLFVGGGLTTGAPTGGTAAKWKLGVAASVSPTSPNRTIEVDIGGTIYYLAAKTTND
jgi:hypothetical protein